MTSISRTTLVLDTTVNGKTTESYLVDSSSTVHPDDAKLDPADQQISFIIAPLCAIIILCTVIVLVYLFLRKKRLDRLRHHLMPFYNFDPEEEGEDWEAELLDDGGHLNNRRGYKSIERPQIQQTQLSLE